MKILVILLFAIMCIAQLAVPGKMIWDSEWVAHHGTPYKFQTRPVDPSDPFRGKYITLQFLADHVYDTASWTSGESVNVVFTADSSGFATIERITREKPQGPYLHTTITYVDSGYEVHIDLPFDRFYMEESKATPAEHVYSDAARDTARVCYGLVRIDEGRAVITDVMINDRSIKDLVEELGRP